LPRHDPCCPSCDPARGRSRRQMDTLDSSRRRPTVPYSCRRSSSRSNRWRRCIPRCGELRGLVAGRARGAPGRWSRRRAVDGAPDEGPRVGQRDRLRRLERSLFPTVSATTKRRSVASFTSPSPGRGATVVVVGDREAPSPFLAELDGPRRSGRRAPGRRPSATSGQLPWRRREPPPAEARSRRPSSRHCVTGGATPPRGPAYPPTSCSTTRS